MKNVIEIFGGGIGAVCAYLFGEFTTDLSTLLLLIVLDFLLGVLVASVFKTSTKTESGTLSSKVMLKGLVKKICMLCLVAIAYRLDILLNVHMIKSGTIIAFIIEELLSIIENIGLTGVKIPQVISKAIDVLNKNLSEVNSNE